jgi:hypothetical protein
MSSDVTVSRVTDGLQFALGRFAGFARKVSLVALLIGAATFVTGCAVFDSGGARSRWLVIGGIVCAVPFLAAATIAWRLTASALRAPRLIDEIRAFTDRSGHSAEVLLDYDTGRPIGFTRTRMGSLSAELDERRREYPAFAAAVRSLIALPRLVAIVAFGTFGVGLLGTVLLIGAVID